MKVKMISVYAFELIPENDSDEAILFGWNEQKFGAHRASMPSKTEDLEYKIIFNLCQST